MGTITSIIPDPPPAPPGFVYAFTRQWDTNRVHQIPGEGFRRVVDQRGQLLAEGVGYLQVDLTVPATVHVYRHIIIRPEHSNAPIS